MKIELQLWEGSQTFPQFFTTVTQKNNYSFGKIIFIASQSIIFIITPACEHEI